MLLERKLTLARFPLWCNVFDDSMALLDGKIPYEGYDTISLFTLQIFKNES